MKNKINTDITDSDIDKLFNENNSDFLNETEKIDIVPEELSINNTKKSNHIDRPANTDSEKTRIKKEKSKINEDIEDNINTNISNVKKLTSLEQAKLYIKKLNQLKYEEQHKNEDTKQILLGLKKVNFDNSTECTFHIYVPKDILGNQLHCYCKFCSSYKMFTNDEWDDYCIKYRKWF